MPGKKEIKSAFESMMFIWGEPLEAKTAGEVMGVSTEEAYAYFKEIQTEYKAEERGIAVREIDGAFQFITKRENFEHLRRLCTPVKERRLSQSALEVLAIIAYRQPVTKGEIDAIRGVKSERIIDGLIKKDLVEEIGRSAAIGRPILYGTTKGFLRHFGFESLKELPEIEDLEDTLNERENAAGMEQLELDFTE